MPESRYLFNNTSRDILAVAEAMLDGEIAYREGLFDEAFAHLRRAIELDDALPYDEPWGWMQPTRHAYGALLLEQGQVEEAATVYEADLGLDPTLSRPCQHPGNLWSLHGYHECLQRLGRSAEAAIIGRQLELQRPAPMCRSLRHARAGWRADHPKSTRASQKSSKSRSPVIRTYGATGLRRL